MDDNIKKRNFTQKELRIRYSKLPVNHQIFGNILTKLQKTENIKVIKKLAIIMDKYVIIV